MSIKKEKIPEGWERWYSFGEVAALLECSHTTLYRYIRNGRIRARKVLGGWRFLERDLVAFQQQEASK